MASGPTGHAPNSSSKSFDFGSDDILCSHEDYGNQDGYNGIHSDSSNSTKEFNKSRMARSSVYPAATYSTPDESSIGQDVVFTVENTVKKYTDNIMRFLEGISSRMSQLELYCYNLDKSIGEMRSDFARDHGESESKLKSVDKHIQEVHRSVQILRDKQELVDTQKELAKLQLAQKEADSGSNKQQNEERAPASASESKNSENSSDFHDQQLALALPHQVAPQPSVPARSVEHQQPSVAPQSSMPPQGMTQVQAYGLPPQQLTNIPAPSQQSQSQYLPAQSQVQDLSRMPLQPTQPQGNMNPQVQPLPPYQQQWPQQLQQSVQPTQQSVMPPQIRASSPLVYSSYLPGQPNQSMAEMPPGSMHMQVSYAGSRPGSGGSDGLPYGYSAAARPIQQHAPTQQLKTGYAVQSGEGGYMSSGPRPQLPPGNAYMVYDSESGRSHHLPPQPQFQQNVYPPTSIPSQNPPRVPSTNVIGPPPQASMRGHPYNELIEKLVGMGYRSDHVLGVIQRLEESGQAIDFNAVLDRLNGHSSGSQRGW